VVNPKSEAQYILLLEEAHFKLTVLDWARLCILQCDSENPRFPRVILKDLDIPSL